MTKPIYSIGIGPGDPELITVKAKRLMEEADVVFVPQSSRQGKSVAREIVMNYIPESKISMYFFPMNNDQEELLNRYSELAQTMVDLQGKGQQISYVSLGDPTIFSTSNYLTAQLTEHGVNVIHIPGISTLNMASTTLGLPLSVKGENFGVFEMPAETGKAVELIRQHSTVVFMKVNKKLPVLIEAVHAAEPEIAYLVRRMGLADEAIFDLTNPENLPDAAYLSAAYIKITGNEYCRIHEEKLR